MPKIEVQLIEEFDLRIVHLREAVSYKDITDLYAREFDPRLTRHVIWEVAPGTMQMLSMDDLKALMTSRKAAMQQRAGGVTVYVASDPSEQTLVRWYKTFAETQAGVEIDFRTASSVEEAIEIVRAAEAPK